MNLINYHDFRTAWQAVFLFAPAEVWTCQKATSYLAKAKLLDATALLSPNKTTQKELEKSAKKSSLIAKLLLTIQWPLHFFVDTPCQLIATLPFVIISHLFRLQEELQQKKWGIALGRVTLLPLLLAGETTLITISIGYRTLTNLLPLKAIKAWQPENRIQIIRQARSSLRFSHIEHWAEISYVFKSKKAFLKEFPLPSDSDFY